MTKLSELSKPVAWTSARSLDVRRKITAFTDAVSAAEYASDNCWEKIAPLYSQQVVSALLAELESKDKRIAELDRSETQLIEERDVAHDAIDAMYEAATGERPEWSNWFGFADAVEEVAQMRAKLATPVQLPPTIFCPEKYVGSLFWSESEAYNKAICNCAEAIRAAGFEVEGDV